VGTDESNTIIAVMLLDLDSGTEEPFGTYALIQEIDVHREHQGKGLGKKLVEFAEEKARAAGRDALLSSTHPGNEGSLRLHASCNFQPRSSATADEESPLVQFVKKLT
jgi:GNAT superfamily N-acetyltransferase